MVEGGLQGRDRQHADHLGGQLDRRLPLVRAEAQGADGELVGADVDRREHGHQAGQVEPGGEPAETAAAQDRGPVVEPAGGGKGRGDLRHRGRHGQRQQAGQRPAQADGGRPGAAKAFGERGDAAGQDADDRQRDGEVREAAHPPQQFLAIAEAGQQAGVGGRHGLALAHGIAGRHVAGVVSRRFAGHQVLALALSAHGAPFVRRRRASRQPP